MGKQKSAKKCAEECRGTSSMFSFERKDSESCIETGCFCYCELGTGPNNTCPTADSDHYDLYRFASFSEGIKYWLKS